MDFAVIFTYSFDREVPVYPFSDEESAKKFLKDSYEEELRIDQEENGWDTCGEISDDGRYAKIVNHFSDREDVTEFRIGDIHACPTDSVEIEKRSFLYTSKQGVDEKRYLR